jgi:hypothetical protein
MQTQIEISKIRKSRRKSERVNLVDRPGVKLGHFPFAKPGMFGHPAEVRAIVSHRHPFQWSALD